MADRREDARAEVIISEHIHLSREECELLLLIRANLHLAIVLDARQQPTGRGAQPLVGGIKVEAVEGAALW